MISWKYMLFPYPICFPWKIAPAKAQSKTMQKRGQVKYGYAKNVDEMIDRLKYDIIYIENMSLYVDFKIMIYTIKIIFQGRGK